jgi:hypothetical protein
MIVVRVDIDAILSFEREGTDKWYTNRIVEKLEVYRKSPSKGNKAPSTGLRLASVPVRV